MGQTGARIRGECYWIPESVTTVGLSQELAVSRPGLQVEC